MFVCSFPLNIRGLKSHDHETWLVGPLSDLELNGPSGILIFVRVAPQARAARFFFCSRLISVLNLRGLKSHDHETWHVGPLIDLDVHGLSGILIFGRVAPQATT